MNLIRCILAKQLLILALFSALLTGTTQAGNENAPDSTIPAPASTPLHVDPLDEGRASAMHRGPDPHSKLSPQQQISVALKHFKEGRLPQALAVMDQTIAGNPQNADLHHVRATLYLANDDNTAALSNIEQAVKLNPGDPLYRVTRAQIYLKFERVEEAMADLDEAVALNPDLVPARFNRGTLLTYQEQYYKALEDFDRCIAVEPHLPAPYFNRGAVFYALGELLLAQKDIRRFIEISDVEEWKQSGRDLLKAWGDAEATSEGAAASANQASGQTYEQGMQ